MDGSSRFFNKRRLILAFFLLAVLWLVWFLASYTWLTISYADNNEATISIRPFGDELEQDRFNMQNSSKTILIRKDTYKFRANTKDRVSAYKKSLGFFRDRLDIELMPQQKSAFLGKSLLPCAKDKKNQVLFASCAPLGKNNQITSSKRGFLFPQNRSGFEIDFFSSALLKDYKDGYLAFWIKDGGLAASPREVSGLSKDLVTSNFEGEIRDDWVGVSPAGNFAIYDNIRNEVINLKDASDMNPSRIKLKAENNDLHPSLLKRLLVSKDYVYLFALAVDHHEFESSDDIEAHSEGRPEDARSKIFTYEIGSGKLVNELAVPESWEISRIAPSGDNSLLMLVDDLEEGAIKIYRINKDGGLKEVDSLAEEPQDVCWKDNDSFYYLTGIGREVYLYSTQKEASFLVYSGLNQKKINSMACSSGELYFYFDLTGEDSSFSDKYFGYHHYMLTDSFFAGRRIEDLTPLFVVVGGVGGDIVEVNQVRGGATVEMSLDNNRSFSKKAIREAIIKKMREEGANPIGLTFKFKF
ncbi:MAG: hypothetical protein WD885_00285 [Candidatus Saccharimonadales bacterium]